MTLPGLGDVAAGYAGAVLDAVRREYPNSPRHVLDGAGDLADAARAASGLLRLLRLALGRRDALGAGAAAALRAVGAARRPRPGRPGRAPDARTRCRSRREYLLDHLGWERPYGWGWAARLCAELESWDDDADAARWAAAARPLAEAVTRAFVDWLPRVRYPERSGAHGNAAFALCRALPLARRSALTGDAALLDAISDAAVRWFAADVGYPAAWEPSGSDFLSPALAEAELIAEIGRPRDRSPTGSAMFLPHLDQGLPDSLFTPAVVTDAGDGQGAHLHGLNLHRAYAFGLLAERLGERDPRRPVLRAARDRHAAVSLPAVVGAGWMVEHWLPAFAVLLLS